MRPITFLLCLLAMHAAAAQTPAAPVRLVERPRVSLPLQPFTVELVDLARGKWVFVDAFGQHLRLDEPVTAYAYAAKAEGTPEVAILCCDPEFPGDLDHAVLKVVGPSAPGGSRCRIEEPCFTATVEVLAPRDGAFQCRLSEILLGPAVSGDRYVHGLYLLAGGIACPLWLASAGEAAPGLRLLTERVGSVFSEGEPVRVVLAALAPGAGQRRCRLQVRDYARGDVVWRGEAAVPAGAPGRVVCTLPLERFGVFEVSAAEGQTGAAMLRVCRVPRPRSVPAEESRIGINLFQQQIWWYAYQVPLMAQAGVRWIRPWLAWENIWPVQQPAPDQWETRALDAGLRRMDRYGQRYQDILFASPAWVLEGAKGPAPPAAKMDAWARYVEDLARRYRGRIPCYEIWNEPDLMWPEASRHSGEHYVALLKSGYAAAKRGDPGCRVLGLSHAVDEGWLERVGSLGAAPFMDVATIHSYTQPSGFLAQVERRKEILRRHGMGDKPLWINEIGATAYDFSPEYSRAHHCSERRQAQTLVAQYALALSTAPGGKVFWFCTLDPRDPAHPSHWTWDAGIGVLYLGYLPKLSYAALAGVARQLDGRDCVGTADVMPGVHQVSFAGPVSVLWQDNPEERRVVGATEAGCAPGERIVVRDLLANQIAAGKAADIRLDLSLGPLYVEGSRELAAIVRAQQAGTPGAAGVTLPPGGTAVVRVPAPAGARVKAEVQPGLPITVKVRPAEGGSAQEIVLSAPADAGRAGGVVRVVTRLPKGTYGLAADREVSRAVAVTLGEPNLVRDGSFFAGGMGEWSPERESAFAWDGDVGHSSPGSLRLDAPFDRRLVHWNIVPAAGRPVKLRCWVRTEGLSGCRATLNLALFGPEKWLTTWCLGTTGAAGKIEGGWQTVEHWGRMPTGTADWSLVEAEIDAAAIPAGTAKAALFVDVSGGGSGRLWIDDVDLWQPAGK